MDVHRAFDILGVTPQATPAEIKEAYRDLVAVWHPDRHLRNERLRRKAEERLKEINAAYSLLMSPEVRHPTDHAETASGRRATSRPQAGGQTKGGERPPGEHYGHSEGSRPHQDPPIHPRAAGPVGRVPWRVVVLVLVVAALAGLGRYRHILHGKPVGQAATSPVPVPVATPTPSTIEWDASAADENGGLPEALPSASEPGLVSSSHPDQELTSDAKGTHPSCSSSSGLAPRRTGGVRHSFDIGSSEDVVIEVQGTPDGVSQVGSLKTLRYGYSTIGLRDGRVEDYSNISGNLKARVEPSVRTGAKHFGVGSSEDLVLEVQGTPDGVIQVGSHNTLRYGYSTIGLRDGRVEDYSDISGNLKVRVEPSVRTGAKHFGVGSSEDLVLEVQGTPDGVIQVGSLKTLRYGYSTIGLRDGRVEDYSNISGNLKVK